MAQHDTPSGSVWIVQVGIAIASAITGTIGSWLVLRGKKTDADTARQQTETTRELHYLDVAADERGKAFESLWTIIADLRTRIEKLEAERDANEAEIDRLRVERNKALRTLAERDHTVRLQAMELVRHLTYDARIQRLEQQVRSLGAEPTNGH